MPNKIINVIGIMIDAEDNDFKLHHLEESWEVSIEDGTHSRLSSYADSWVESLKDILDYLSIGPDVNTQFVIVYDASCPNKEEQIKKVLAHIKVIPEYRLLPTLVSIGDEPWPWNEDITSQVSIIKEVQNTHARTRNDFFKDIIRQEFSHIKTELLSTDDTATQLIQSSVVEPSHMQEESLEALTVPSTRINAFIDDREAQEQADAQSPAEAQLQATIPEQAAMTQIRAVPPARVTQELRAAQTSHAFQFRCLAALGVVSTLTLALGIAALFLLTPITLGIGMTLIGAVGALTSGYGLFTLAPPVREQAQQPALNNI